MRIYIFIFKCLLLCEFSIGQSFQKPQYLGIAFEQQQFQSSGATYLARSLSGQFIYTVSSHFTFGASISGGFAKALSSDKLGHSNLFLSGIGSMTFNFLKDQRFIVPFSKVDISLQYFNNSYALLGRAGLGAKVNIWKDAYLHLSSQYQNTFSTDIKPGLVHSIGIAGLIKTERKLKSSYKKPVRVPQLAAMSESRSVIDSDLDGIADSLDKCLLVPGFVKYEGCPVPDTDYDGINDESDSCKITPGFSRFKGCPVPDQDGDGLNDEIDQCQAVAGPKENNGCPIIQPQLVIKVNHLARQIFFETASFALKQVSNKPLQELTALLQLNPSTALLIEGHTDNQGRTSANLVLSQRRADTIKDYLIKQGLERGRLTATGYGQSQPIDTNSSEEGRAKNRRVELKIK